ncbi:MAG: histidine phosphatase family protein [Gemmatimonadota bacterium]
MTIRALRRIAPVLVGVLVAGLWPGAAHAQASLIILARHAEKSAASGDPGLTAAGEQRARDLAAALAGVHLSAIITTQYRRTQLTAAPAASASHIQPTVISAAGNSDVDAALVARALDALPAGSAALVIGHSNTLGPIIKALGGPALPDLCDGEYSTLLILERTAGADPAKLIRSRYGAAEPAEASQCH